MRPLWTGIISFGLINIPVKLYNASREKKFDFQYLRKKDLCPIKYKKVCGRTNEEVLFKDIVHGYQFEKGKYVLLEDKDLKNAMMKRSEAIEITEFVDAKAINAKFFDKPYYLEPEKGAQKTYALLREALKKSGLVGLAKFAQHTREYLIAIMPDEDILLLNHLRFAEQFKDPHDLELPKKVSYTPKELEVAMMLIKELAAPFHPNKFKDTYADELRALIDKKIKGEPITIKLEKAPIPTAIPDIMSKLKESLAYAKSKKH